MAWKTIRRETGLIEHVCEHGTGHPNAGSIQYMEFMTSEDFRNYWEADVLDAAPYPEIPSEPYIESAWGVHGCDGCCGRDNWPGTAANAIKHAINRYQSERPDLLLDLKTNHFLLWWGIMAALNEAKDLDG